MMGIILQRQIPEREELEILNLYYLPNDESYTGSNDYEKTD